MPKSFDVIVLGLGGMGSATAYQLAKNGLKVLGLEQFSPVHNLGSSHGESRIIRKAYFEHPNYVPLLQRSYELWAELEKEAKAQVYYQTGLVYFGEASSGLLEGVKKSASLYSLPLREYSKREAEKKFPSFKLPGSEICLEEPEAGFLKPEESVRHFIESAQKRGAQLQFSEPLRQWKSTGSKISVETEKGKYEADRLVITPGAWAQEQILNLDLKLKLKRKTIFWYEAGKDFEASSGFPCFLVDTPEGEFYGFPKFSSRGFKIAEHSGGEVFEHPKLLDREIRKNDEDPVLNFRKKYLPGIQGKSIGQAVCMYVMSPDENFIIDRHPEFSNVVFAAGFSGHGFKFCSVAGEILKDLVVDGQTRHPIDFLRLREAKTKF